ncbi:MAG: GDP-mannose 4,6-dehydratase [Candidatus Levybacteria bacterium]|nr:GDP-mannose 4,6-dehydratase [Candidatus Levybacteria bacterium]MBP9815293.1 GDP-mannose 4,6-dehydratase [Candidatus Levybacteria bacterium]
MKKAFITGISGFAGSFLAELLLTEGLEVHGTHISSDTKNIEHIKSRMQLHRVDLLEKEKIQKCISEVQPDMVYHLAALTSPAESFSSPETVVINNVTAQIHLLEALRLYANTPRIMIISSAEVYGIVNSSDLPISESVELRPGSPYAVSKIAQDYLGLQYFLSYGMDIIRVRPFNHIGPRQSASFVVSSFAKQIAEAEKSKNGKEILVGNLDAKRDFTDVRDMVRAYLLLAQKGESGEVYNIGSGLSHKISDILGKLVSLSYEKIETKVDPSRMRPSDVPDIRSDNTKIKNLTNWEPTIPLDQTLKDTLDYWRDNV